MLPKIFDVFVWENSARLNEGGEKEDLPRFLAGIYVSQQNQSVDP